MKLLHLRTMHLGPDEVLVGLKIICDDALAVGDAAQFIDLIEARLRAELPTLKRIYVELGTRDAPKATATEAAATP